MKDALELLRNDHVAVRGLLADLEAMAPHATRKKKLEMLDLIEREVKIHTDLEERLFYPAFRAAGDRGRDRELLREALSQHHQADRLLPDLKVLVLTQDAFAELLHRVRQLVDAHAEMEERQMFPRARELLGPEGLHRLGEDITHEKQELFHSWRGRTTGPLHRARSLVDKLTPLAVKRRRVARRSRAWAAAETR